MEGVHDKEIMDGYRIQFIIFRRDECSSLVDGRHFQTFACVMNQLVLVLPYHSPRSYKFAHTTYSTEDACLA